MTNKYINIRFVKYLDIVNLYLKVMKVKTVFIPAIDLIDEWKM